MKLDWSKVNGLMPAIVQDSLTQQVLMLGYMNEQALADTQRTGRVTFWSRSKQRLWVKGESSGNFLELASIEADCDGDTLLVQARPAGPACHRDTVSCFNDVDAAGIGFLGRLTQVIDQRVRQGGEESYVAKLAARGLDRAAQKVGEEAVETVIAAKNDDREKLLSESADLLFHLMVLLRLKDASLADVTETLHARHQLGA